MTKGTWMVMVVDPETEVGIVVERGLSHKKAVKWCSRWDHRMNEAAAIPWPECVSVPRRVEMVDRMEVGCEN